MKKLLITLLLFVITAYSALAVCLTPTNNLMINATSDLCNTTTYYLNDTDSNGIILINANNIELNCLGAVIVGNRTGYGIKDYNFKRTNITLNGCSFSNYTRGIEWSTPNGSRILNSNFSGNAYNAYIYHNSKQSCGLFPNFLINNSYFDNSYSSSSTSIYLENGANFELQNVKSRNNQGRGLYLVQSACSIVNNSIITNNSLGLSAGVNAWFSVGSDNALVENTDFSYSAHGGADDSCLNPIVNNSIFRGNTLNYCGHFGINLCQNYSINNNTFDGNSLFDSSIYLCAGTNNRIINNVVQSPGDEEDADLRGGITIENGNGYVVNSNNVSNNIVNNSLTACLISGSYGNVWRNNTLSNCNASDVRVYNGGASINTKNTDSFIDNNYVSGVARYVRNSVGAFNITINETSSVNHTFQIPIQTGSIINLLFNYNGRKDLRLDNATPYINLNTPFNDVKNGSVLVVSDVSSYSTTIQSGELWSVGDFLNACTAPLNNTPDKDTSGNGNTLSNSGAVYNVTGGNYVFDGINDYMSNTSQTISNINQTVTLSLWVKLSSLGKDHGLYSNFKRVNANSFSNGYGLSFRSSNKFTFETRNTTNTNNVITSPLTYTNNTWYFVVGTFDGQNSSLYIDGVKVVNGTYTMNPENSTNRPFCIGVVCDGITTSPSTWYTNGSIDNVMIFNRSLSSSEVLALYNSQYVDRNGLVAEYKFTNDTFWQIPMRENCTINNPFNGTILLNGTGQVYLNSTINTSNIWLPRIGQTRWFMSNARLY